MTLVGFVITGKYPVVSIDSMKCLVFSCDWNFNKSMLKSPMIYDSLFSLFILVVNKLIRAPQLYHYASQGRISGYESGGRGRIGV